MTRFHTKLINLPIRDVNVTKNQFMEKINLTSFENDQCTNVHF